MELPEPWEWSHLMSREEFLKRDPWRQQQLIAQWKKTWRSVVCGHLCFEAGSESELLPRLPVLSMHMRGQLVNVVQKAMMKLQPLASREPPSTVRSRTE